MAANIRSLAGALALDGVMESDIATVEHWFWNAKPRIDAAFGVEDKIRFYSGLAVARVRALNDNNGANAQHAIQSLLWSERAIADAARCSQLAEDVQSCVTTSMSLAVACRLIQAVGPRDFHLAVTEALRLPDRLAKAADWRTEDRDVYRLTVVRNLLTQISRTSFNIEDSLYVTNRVMRGWASEWIAAIDAANDREQAGAELHEANRQIALDQPTEREWFQMLLADEVDRLSTLNASAKGLDPDGMPSEVRAYLLRLYSVGLCPGVIVWLCARYALGRDIGMPRPPFLFAGTPLADPGFAVVSYVFELAHTIYEIADGCHEDADRALLLLRQFADDLPDDVSAEPVLTNVLGVAAWRICEYAPTESTRLPAIQYASEIAAAEPSDLSIDLWARIWAACEPHMVTPTVGPQWAVVAHRAAQAQVAVAERLASLERTSKQAQRHRVHRLAQLAYATILMSPTVRSRLPPWRWSKPSPLTARIQRNFRTMAQTIGPLRTASNLCCR